MRADELHAIPGVGLDVWSYSSLIKGFVQSSELQSALEVLQEMKSVKGAKPNEVGRCASSLLQGQRGATCLVLPPGKDRTENGTPLGVT